MPIGISIVDAYRLAFLNSDSSVSALYDWSGVDPATEIGPDQAIGAWQNPGASGTLAGGAKAGFHITDFTFAALDPGLDTDRLMPASLRTTNSEALVQRSELNQAAQEVREGQLDMARERLTALARTSDNAEALIMLAELEVRKGSTPDDAARQYLKVLEVQPDNALAMNNLANYLLLSNKPNDALVWARKAMQRAPQSPVVADTLGWIYFRQGKYSEARPLLEQSLRAAVRPVAYYHLAGVLAKTGDMARAREQYELGLKLDAKSEARADVSSLFENHK